MYKKILIIVQSLVLFTITLAMEKSRTSQLSKKRKRTDITKQVKSKVKRTKLSKSTAFLDMTNKYNFMPNFYYGGRPIIKKKNENEYITGELVDLNEKDPIKRDTFAQLIAESHSQGLPYILAVLTTQVDNQTYSRRYQDAGGLVAWMYNQDFTLQDSNRKKYVQTQKPIEMQKYFILYPGNKKFEYLGNQNGILEVTQSYYNTSEQFLEKNLLVNANIATSKDIEILGWMYKKKNKYDLAEKYYLMSLEKDKNNTAAMIGLGVLYFNQGKYDLAEKYLLTALAKDPDNLTIINNLGTLYVEQGEYDQAEKYYLKALEKDKDNLKAMIGLGVLYFNQGKYDLAEKYYLDALEKYPNNAEAMINLVYLFAMNKNLMNKSLAFNYYQQVLQNKKLVEAYSKKYPDRWRIDTKKINKVNHFY